MAALYTDRLFGSPKYFGMAHPLSGRTQELGAAAVLQEIGGGLGIPVYFLLKKVFDLPVTEMARFLDAFSS